MSDQVIKQYFPGVYNILYRPFDFDSISRPFRYNNVPTDFGQWSVRV